MTVIGNWLRRLKEADPNLELEKVELQPELYRRRPKRLKKVYPWESRTSLSSLWDIKHNWGRGCWVPTGPLGLHLPSFKSEERARSQQQRHQWFNGQGELTCLKKGPGVTPTVCSGQRTGRGSSLCSQGEGEITSYKRNWQQVGSLVTRKLAEGHSPHHPFDKHSGEFWSKARTIISFGPGASM